MRSSKALLAAALGSLVAAPAFAGGVAPVIVEPAPVVIAPAPKPVADWSGVYGGLSYGQLDGEFSRGGFNNDIDGGGNAGLFAGYNFQAGNLVYGAEIAYHVVNDAVQDGAVEEGMGNILDLHGRIGFAAGRALLYSKVGYSMTNYEFAGGAKSDFDGVSYGLGADFLVTDNIFLGLDYTQRDLKGDNSLNLDASTLGLRVGYKF